MASELSGQSDTMEDPSAESSVCFDTEHDCIQEPCSDVFFDCQESVARPTSDAAPPDDIEDQEASADDEDAEIRDYFEQASKEALPNQTMTKAQAVLLILCLVVGGGFSWTQVDGILKLINTLFGATIVPDSKYMFRKLWRQKMSTIKFHYYCHIFFSYLGIRPSNNLPEEKVTCESCNESYEPRTLIAKGHFFLTFDIKRQLHICCSVDSPSRAVLLNMKQFNGYFGCSWCLEEGTLVNGTLRYILHGSPAQDRTHTGVVNYTKAAFRQGQPGNGIKGPSVLLPLKGIDLVWCLPPDYMHCVLEGVTKQLTELWLSATGAPYYIGGCPGL
ncbi:hypothetical protein HPB47_026540 [Ixodes persulcatus]|uniref:Uncharacterized protein n=1 Tax=Ixodes persulcatus TaxID=34615 RepID=A0AC60PYJ7_IXOPE|nr:hypothetical protein HPB47_026540 [Ixodes persulcatus]